MMDGAKYNSMETGVTTSYGAKMAQPINGYNDYNVYVTLVQPNSPFAKAGIKRGFRLTKLGGVAVENLIREKTFDTELNKLTNNFTFLTPQGQTLEKQLSQADFQSCSVVKTALFNNKVGYILYSTFNKALEGEIKSAVSELKQKGITDLILDLRYNGGGDLDVCTDIAGLIAPEKAAGKVFVTLQHNDNNAGEDVSYKIKITNNSLCLNRLFVISNKATASASESIINCLKPYMEVIQVGETTYGKPNGMYVFKYPQKVPDSQITYAFLPICFYCVNSLGEGFYDSGIAPVKTVYDDMYHDFSENEEAIKQCLNYIATGAFTEISYKKSKSTGGASLSELPQNYGLCYIEK